MKNDKDTQRLLSELKEALKEDMQKIGHDIVLDEDGNASLFDRNGNLVMPEFDGEVVMSKSRFYRDEHNYTKAAGYMRKMTREFARYCNTYGIRDDNEKIFLNFHGVFENAMYVQMNLCNKREVYIYDYFPVVRMYIEYADVLFAQQKYDEAKQMLFKAKKWNPVHFETLYKIAEIDKATGQLEEYFKKTKELFYYAYKLEDIASCYDNLGYYFLEQELYEVAYACYTMAEDFYDYDVRALRGKNLIIDYLGNDDVDDSYEKLEEYAEKYGFSSGYFGFFEDLSTAYGKRYFEEKDYDNAEVFLKVAYDLTGEDEVKKMLDVIEKAQEEDQ